MSGSGLGQRRANGAERCASVLQEAPMHISWTRLNRLAVTRETESQTVKTGLKSIGASD